MALCCWAWVHSGRVLRSGELRRPSRSVDVSFFAGCRRKPAQTPARATRSRTPSGNSGGLTSHYAFGRVIPARVYTGPAPMSSRGAAMAFARCQKSRAGAASRDQHVCALRKHCQIALARAHASIARLFADLPSFSSATLRICAAMAASMFRTPTRNAMRRSIEFVLF